jgi:signal recognition particle subunit SEC65
MNKPEKNHEAIVKKLSNTTSTVKLDNTITKPDAKKIINAVATILHSQMVEDQANPRHIEEKSDLFYFSEEKYILERPEEYNESRKALLREMPTIESIAEFMNALYECGQFSIECCVVCLVYINRFISISEMPLQPN